MYCLSVLPCCALHAQAHEHLHANAPRDDAQRRLEAVLVRMCVDYEDPHQPAFHPMDLIDATNGCLHQGASAADRFVGGDQADALEFLVRNPGGLLLNLALEHQYLVSYLQQGHCVGCGNPYQQAGHIHIFFCRG